MHKVVNSYNFTYKKITFISDKVRTMKNQQVVYKIKLARKQRKTEINILNKIIKHKKSKSKYIHIILQIKLNIGTFNVNNQEMLSN